MSKFDSKVAATAGWLVMAPLLASLVGCGDRPPATYETAVTVTYPDKTPVVGAFVALISEETKITGRGETGPDGSCKVAAAAGKNIVVVSKPPLIGDPDKPYTGPKIADRFASAGMSDLAVEVTEDPSQNHFSITITAR